MSKPYPFQLQGVRRIHKFGGRALLADEMGLGKTCQTIWYFDWYLDNGPVVVICPANLKYNWKKEIKKHAGRTSAVLSGRKPSKQNPKRRRIDNRVYIINYDILTDPKNRHRSWLAWLRQLRPKLVIFDEAHYVKNMRAQRTKNVKELCRGVPHVIAITGTPITSVPADLWTILNILLPEKYGSFFSYAKRYCQPRKTRFGWEFKGAERLDELHRKLTKRCMIRRLKKDVLKDLPDKIRSVVPVEIENRKEYDEYKKSVDKWFRANESRQDGRVKIQRQAMIMDLKRLAAKLKIKAVIEWISNFMESTDDKLIVFGVHKIVLGAIRSKFAKSAVLVDGSVTGKKRQFAVEKFNGQKDCRLFIGNIHAAGVGWSATGCSNVLFAELDWVPANHNQAEDRVHGINRGVAGSHPNVYYLVGRDTVEETLCGILERKQRISDHAIDNNRAGNTINVYSILEQALYPSEEQK